MSLRIDELGPDEAKKIAEEFETAPLGEVLRWAWERFGKQAAIGTIGGSGAGEVGFVRIFPGLGHIFGLRRRHVGAVMHPAMPARRNGRGFRVTVEDNPAALSN